MSRYRSRDKKSMKQPQRSNQNLDEFKPFSSQLPNRGNELAAALTHSLSGNNNYQYLQPGWCNPNGIDLNQQDPSLDELQDRMEAVQRQLELLREEERREMEDQMTAFLNPHIYRGYSEDVQSHGRTHHSPSPSKDRRSPDNRIKRGSSKKREGRKRRTHSPRGLSPSFPIPTFDFQPIPRLPSPVYKFRSLASAERRSSRSRRSSVSSSRGRHDTPVQKRPRFSSRETKKKEARRSRSRDRISMNSREIRTEEKRQSKERTRKILRQSPEWGWSGSANKYQSDRRERALSSLKALPKSMSSFQRRNHYKAKNPHGCCEGCDKRKILKDKLLEMVNGVDEWRTSGRKKLMMAKQIKYRYLNKCRPVLKRSGMVGRDWHGKICLERLNID